MLRCNGEKITSLKEIANRFTAPTVPCADSPAWTKMNNDYLASGHANISRVDIQTVPGGITLSLHNNTMKGFKQSNYEAVANIFRFAYGGRRYKMMSVGPAYMMCRLIHAPNYTGPNSRGKKTPAGVLRIEDAERGRYSVAPASTAAVPISGEMIVENEINNFMEVERPFYSNRKLISTRQPFTPSSADYLSCSDDVFTQFVAISKDTTDLYEKVMTGEEITQYRVGPCLMVGDTTSQPIIPTYDSVPSIITERETYSFISNYPKLSFKERTFLVNEVYGSDVFKCTKIVTGDVLEALGTGAGLTFHQAPPCVIFG